MKYDFWPNYLIALQNLNLKHYVISAILETITIFFKKSGAWMYVISNFDHLFVQNEDSKYMLLTRNITQVSNVGDTRFDRVLEITNDVNKLPILDLFKGDIPLFIFGSTWGQGRYDG